MNQTTTTGSNVWSVAAGVMLGAAILVLFIALATSPWLLAALLGIAVAAAFALACLWAAGRIGMLGGRHIAPWAEGAAWAVVVITIVFWLRSPGFAADLRWLLLIWLAAPATVGAVLQQWPRVLVGVEALLCGAYLLYNGRLLIDAAGCWSCRSGDMSDGGYAMFSLLISTVWLATLLASITCGMSLTRRLRRAFLKT